MLKPLVDVHKLKPGTYAGVMLSTSRMLLLCIFCIKDLLILGSLVYRVCIFCSKFGKF